MREKIIVIILFLIFGLFSFYRIFFQNKPQVLKIITPNIIQIDLNGNNITDNGETICVDEIQTFSADFKNENIELADKLGISYDDGIKIGYLTDEFAAKTLAGKFVKVELSNRSTPLCRYGKIFLEEKNYSDMLYSGGFGANTQGEVEKQAFNEILSKAKNLKLVILNHKNLKYHTLNCKYGKVASDAVVIKENELPKSAKPCKFCHLSKIEKKNVEKYQSVSTPQSIITDENITFILTDFTKILKPDRNCSHQACKTFVNLISEATQTIDIAIYGWADITKVNEALDKAKLRGVKIRLVYDTAINKPNYYTETENFIKRYIDVKSDAIDGNKKLTNMLMHNKFAIFDNQKVYTGSMNFSSTGFSGFNHNSIIIINSATIAQLYEKEFNQMFEGKFHTLKEKSEGNKNIISGHSKISVFFSPQDKGISDYIVPIVKKAEKYIYIPTFILTHKDLSNELINAHKRGVNVKIIIDATSTGVTHSKFKELRMAGIPVKVENYAGKMHAKSIIIDDKYMVIGSANFSSSGENKNDENMLVIENQKLAEFYRQYFEYFWSKIPDRYLKHTVSAESKYSIGSCSDGIDNDFDGKIDFADERCKNK